MGRRTDFRTGAVGCPAGEAGRARPPLRAPPAPAGWGVPRLLHNSQAQPRALPCRPQHYPAMGAHRSRRGGNPGGGLPLVASPGLGRVRR